MDNPEKLATLRKKTLENTEGAINNPEKVATLGKNTLENTEGAINNGQSRETDRRGQYIIRRENKTIPVTHKIKENYITTDRKYKKVINEILAFSYITG